MVVDGDLWQFEIEKVIASCSWKCFELLREYVNEKNNTILGVLLGMERFLSECCTRAVTYNAC